MLRTIFSVIPFIFIIALQHDLLAQEQSSVAKVSGFGLPRDIQQLAPEQSSYPSWPEGDYPTINTERMQAVVDDLSKFALEDQKLNNYWGRLPGTMADKNTFAYLNQKLKALGFKVSENKTFIPKEWKPLKWQLSYRIGNNSYALTTAFPSGEGQRKTASVSGEAVWLGLGAESDFKGRDIKGRIAVIYSLFVPGGRSHSASNRAKLFYANKRAAESGAVMIINIMAVPGDGQFMPAPHYLTSGKVIKPLDIPIVTLSQDEGLFLEEQLAKSAVDMTYQVDWQEQTNLEASYLIAELPGKTQEEIIIAAHTDGYFQGALDNASGVAVALEMANYYSSLDEPPMRTIKLFFFNDHHHGEFSRREFEEKYDWQEVALVITVEHPSQTQLYWYNNGLMTANSIGAFRWNVSGSEVLENLVVNNLTENGISLYTMMDKKPKFTQQAPSFHIIDHVIYHTTLDRPELVPVEGLKRATQGFLAIVDAVNKLRIEDLR